MISSAYTDDIRIQRYDKAPVIEGVSFAELELFIDEGGDFAEMGRFNRGFLESFPGFEVMQISVSTMLPGVVKAFHIHKKQDDIFYIPPNKRLLVGLKDVREDSPTKDLEMRITLGGHKNRLLFVPRGVAHGVGNLWPTESMIIYFMNNQFDPKDPDELRLPADLMGEHFWELRQE